MKRVPRPESQPPITSDTPLPERILADPRLLELLALAGVAAFARRFGLSESSLRREMRANGHSLRGLVAAWRRRTVITLLPTAPSLDLLAQRLGFSGAVSLSRWVKTQFGVTPRRLRRRLRESRATADLLSGESGRVDSLDGLTENAKSGRNGKVQAAGNDETLDA